MTFLLVECSSIVFDFVDTCLTNWTGHAYSVLGILHFRVWEIRHLTMGLTAPYHRSIYRVCVALPSRGSSSPWWCSSRRYCWYCMFWHTDHWMVMIMAIIPTDMHGTQCSVYMEYKADLMGVLVANNKAGA